MNANIKTAELIPRPTPILTRRLAPESGAPDLVSGVVVEAMREIVDVEIMEVTKSDSVVLVVVVTRIEGPVEDG